ncbi:MAG TPA: hypothetical protein VLJ10_02490, partial [Candidatus Bathyarchaeia archaeon]|nr:hypothetical protein [Candidatus Bathyarchaeia archaeon]
MSKLPAQIFHLSPVFFYLAAVVVHNGTVVLVEPFDIIALFSENFFSFGWLMRSMAFERVTDQADITEVGSKDKTN